MGDLGLKAAFGMGLAQSLALMPGVSRSGITITAGRFLGLDRDSAARFSFLLLVPTVLGAVVLKGRDRRPARRPAVGLGRAVPRRHPCGGGERAARDRRPARLRPPPRLLRLRLVPADRGRRRAAADRDRRPLGGLLTTSPTARSSVPRSGHAVRPGRPLPWPRMLSEAHLSRRLLVCLLALASLALVGAGRATAGYGVAPNGQSFSGHRRLDRRGEDAADDRSRRLPGRGGQRSLRLGLGEPRDRLGGHAGGPEHGRLLQLVAAPVRRAEQVGLPRLDGLDAARPHLLLVARLRPP